MTHSWQRTTKLAAIAVSSRSDRVPTHARPCNLTNYTLNDRMLEEKVEKEKLQRCRVERLLATREREKILNEQRRTQYEARCAKMEEAARERARHKQEELQKASEERERLKKVISDQFAEAARRNLEREEAAAIQVKVFMDIAAEEQQRLAKVRGEIASEKARDQYKASARGIRDVQNQRRMQVRREEARRTREEAAQHRRIEETLRKERIAAEMDTSAAPTAFNRCLHNTDKHIMECQCCQPPASWGVTKSIPLAWEISDMARKGTPVKVMPLQDVSVVNTNNMRTSMSSSSSSASVAKKSHQGNSLTRKMIRKDKVRAKQKQQQQENVNVMSKAAACKSMRGSPNDANAATSNTRKMMRKDKARAKRRLGGAEKNHNKAAPGNAHIEIFVDNKNSVAQAECGLERPTKIVARSIRGSDESRNHDSSTESNDVLDKVINELMALDGMYDPQLERLMIERRDLMSHN